MNNKDKIAEATFKLSLKYGFDNVTIKQIQNEADVTAGAIYYHFKDKNDILLHIIDMYLKSEIVDFKEILKLKNKDGSLGDKLKFTFYYHMGIDLENNTESIIKINGNDINYKEYYLFLVGIYHQHPEVREYFHEVSNEMLNFYEDLFKESIKNQEIKSNLDPKETALYIFTIFKGFTEVWSGFPEMSIEKIIDTNVKMICKTIKA